MTPSPDPDPAYAELLLAYDAALAIGRADACQASVIVPENLRREVADAQRCLDLLASAWPVSRPPWSLEGQAVGRFVIEREIGRGGFGIVYLAHDPVLKRKVALKVPRLEGLGHPELRQRFLQEARIAAALEHVHIVPVYEAGEAGGVCYIASAFCPGQNLAEWLAARREPVPIQAAVALTLTLAEAMRYCHDRGVLHRDLKPSNVMLGPALEPRLTDFGLSKLAEVNLTETRTSVILGTPLYMAPEQADGRAHAIGPATDVYALGAILYELLTGRPPFPGSNLAEVLDRIRVQEAMPPAKLRAAVPRHLETICLQCLQKEPHQRYANAGELAADLRRYLTGHAIEARRTGLIDRLRTWSRRPERLGEPALIAFMNGAISQVAMVIGVSSVWSGRLRGGPGDAGLWEYMVSSSIFCAAQVTLGYLTATRHLWALWAGVLGIPLLMIYTTGMVFGFVGTGGFFSQRDPAMQLVLQIVAMTLLTTEFLAFLVALRAWKATQGRYVPALPLPAVETPPPLHEPLPTGWRQRLLNWSRRPERIGEAAILAVLNGMVGVLCTVIPVVSIRFGWLEVSDPASAQWGMLQILLYYPTTHFVLAAYTLARRGWAIKAGAIVTPLMVIWATGIIFGWIDTGDYYSGRDPAMRLSLELAAESMLVLQAVLYALAWHAWQAQQHRRSVAT